MIEKCKIKLVFKSKQTAQLYQQINKKNNRKIQQSSEKLFSVRQKHNIQGLKHQLISQIKSKQLSPNKSFKNSKIRECIITPYELQSSQFQYCKTFQNIDPRTPKIEGFLCQGRKAEYCKQQNLKLSTYRQSRTITRQSSERNSNFRRPSTSEYLSHKKSGYLQLQKFERKKPWSMNPFHYQAIYTQKLKILLDFYFKVQFANRISIDLSLSKPLSPRYRVYVGPGNNQFTIQEILRKRFWYEVVYEPKNCDFYWTQFELKWVHEKQKCLKMSKRWDFSDQEANKVLKQNSQNTNILQKITLNSRLLSQSDSKKVQTLIDSQGYQFVFPELSMPIITNHIPNSEILNQRKDLFLIIQSYYQKEKSSDPWSIMPKTFFVCNPTRSDMHFYTDTVLKNKKKLWIIKPGERANYENQIQILPASKIMDKLRKMIKHGDEPWSFLLQQYIERPFLYKGRKMDLRHYVLITSIGGGLRAYWYYQGYVRTSSMAFKLTDLNPVIHLLSDQIQEKHPEYGHREPANRLTYNDFERYFQKFDPDENHSFEQEILPQMKAITVQLLLASSKIIDPQRRGCNFEIISLDFLIDEFLKVYLTGVNKNPSLRTDNPVEGKIIPSVIQQSLWLGLDPLLPPKTHFPAGQRLRLGADPFQSLRFQCIFNEFQ